MDEPDPKRGRSVEALAGQEVPPRRSRPDPREDERRDHRRHDPEPHLREPEDRVLARNRYVDAGRDAATAAERVALDPGDHGRRARVDRVEHPVEAHGVLDVLVVGEVDRCPLPVDVGAGAEARPLACQDNRPCVADVGERRRELGDQRRVERVPSLRLRQGDAENRAVAFDPERAHRAQLRVAV